MIEEKRGRVGVGWRYGGVGGGTGVERSRLELCIQISGVIPSTMVVPCLKRL